jgi:hypothetical protein
MSSRTVVVTLVAVLALTAIGSVVLVLATSSHSTPPTPGCSQGFYWNGATCMLDERGIG